ncbi:EamA family transporter [bacterium]|nr:EamA family transporter [bacterium]
MHLGLLFLGLRVIGMGLERPLVKRLGQGFNPIAVVTVYVGLGELLFLLLIGGQVLSRPEQFGGDYHWLGLALVPALCNALSFFTFIRAMQVGEVSLLTPLFATAFVLMYVFDTLAGYARLGPLPVLGILLVSLGVIFLNPGQGAAGQAPARWNWRKLNPVWLFKQPGAGLMLLNALGVAGARFFDKTLVDAHLGSAAPPVLYALVVNAPTVLIGLAILGVLSARQNSGGLAELTRIIRRRPATALVLTLAGQGAFIMGLYSLSWFPPSVVEPVTQLGVFIAIALGGLWFNEPVRARWLPAAMVVGGAALLLI